MSLGTGTSTTAPAVTGTSGQTRTQVSLLFLPSKVRDARPHRLEAQGFVYAHGTGFCTRRATIIELQNASLKTREHTSGCLSWAALNPRWLVCICVDAVVLNLRTVLLATLRLSEMQVLDVDRYAFWRAKPSAICANLPSHTQAGTLQPWRTQTRGTAAAAGESQAVG
jgi:hypothetical protein